MAGHGAIPLRWGASRPAERGPVVASPAELRHRNAVGSYSGAYAIYRALAVATRALARDHRPDLTDTAPAALIGVHPQWADPAKIVSLDPWGHLVGEVFAEHIRAGADIRPTIAITRARIATPELRPLLADGTLRSDGRVLLDNGEIRVTKAAIDPVWHLPGLAARFGVPEADLRRTLFEETGGMFPELVTRSDIEVLLPPIGGTTVYLFGEVERIADPGTVIACRVHDECNGSDVFGSDICTCRPYLVHGIEVCVETAQRGGVGIIVYNRKEGRALGEVTKFLVYNARKRQQGGDRADTYFRRTECVAGIQDMRFQELMPDVFHWLGIRRIDRWVSMSNLKHDALKAQGIEVMEQVAIPDRLVPHDAGVEIEAKKAAGYFAPSGVLDSQELSRTKGRALDE
jgi:GTP cyclohydrolase II